MQKDKELKVDKKLYEKKVIKKDLIFLYLTESLNLNQVEWKKIHVVDPNEFGIKACCFCFSRYLSIYGIVEF